MSENSPIKMKVVYSNYSKSESQDNALAEYLKEIAQYPSLSSNEERDLAKRVQEGDVGAR